MLTNNTYFENLKRIGHEYEAARVERQARKQQIIDTLGWDSEELKAWYAEDQAAKFPFEQGACKAARDLRLHQPEHGGHGKSARLCRRRLHDDGPLHHHPAGDPLGRGRALRGAGHPFQPELSTGKTRPTTEPTGSVGRS